MTGVVRRMVTVAWRTVHDPLRWSRLRWLSLAWVVATLTVVQGFFYMYFGNHAILAKNAWTMFERVPGGIRMHGGIMLTLSVPLIISLSLPMFGYPEPRRLLRLSLIAVGAYYLWTATLFALAPVVPGGKFSFTIVSLYAVVSTLPAILTIKPPPELVRRDETALIRAAMGVGVHPEQARQLADNYFRGGSHAAL